LPIRHIARHRPFVTAAALMHLRKKAMLVLLQQSVSPAPDGRWI